MGKKRQKKKQRQRQNKIRRAKEQALRILKEQEIIKNYYLNFKKNPHPIEENVELMEILGSEPYCRATSGHSSMWYSANYIIYIDKETGKFDFSKYRHFYTDVEEKIYFDLRLKKTGV